MSKKYIQLNGVPQKDIRILRHSKDGVSVEVPIPIPDYEENSDEWKAYLQRVSDTHDITKIIKKFKETHNLE